MFTQKVSTFLWFNNNAEDAANFYTSVFQNSSIKEIRRWGPGAPSPEGSVLSATIEIEGYELILFNGGPAQTLNLAVSLFVRCETQEEVDRYWEKLTADGGKPIQCGWLQDKFGLAWQIAPSALSALLQDSDPERSRRAMQAMMKMVKIDIAELQRAANGK